MDEVRLNFANLLLRFFIPTLFVFSSTAKLQSQFLIDYCIIFGWDGLWIINGIFVILWVNFGKWIDCSGYFCLFCGIFGCGRDGGLRRVVGWPAGGGSGWASWRLMVGPLGKVMKEGDKVSLLIFKFYLFCWIKMLRSKWLHRMWTSPKAAPNMDFTYLVAKVLEVPVIEGSHKCICCINICWL